MPIQIRCSNPDCRERLTCPSDFAGSKVRCPKCRSVVRVPGAREKSPDASKKLGQYQLIRKLGEGGMGTVYEAIQEGINRRVALKVLASRLATDPEYVERFRREVQAAGALNHPNLVTVHEVGQDRGHHFFSMEFVEGESLRDRLDREGALPSSDALFIVEKVAEALDHAWHHGQIIHRDIKPANILLTQDGQVKLADLGLAKAVEGDRSVTSTEATMGSPAYMAPEQARDAKSVDCRADIYSLGITLFEMVAGRYPYEETSVFALLLAHEEKPLPDPRAMNPEVPETVCELIRWMCAKKADGRPGSPGELLDGLMQVRAGESPLASAAPAVQGEEPAPTTGERPVKARRTAALAGAGVVAVAVLAIVAFLTLRSGTQPLSVPEKSGPQGSPTTGNISAMVPSERPGKEPEADEQESAGTKHEDMDTQAAKLESMFAYAEEYAKEHPDDFQEVITKYDKVKERAQGTVYEMKAADMVKVWQKRREDAALTEFRRLKSAADGYIRSRRFDEAQRAWEAFPGALVTEGVKEQIQAELTKLDEAMGAVLKQLGVEAAPLLDKEIERVTPAKQQALAALKLRIQECRTGLTDEGKSGLDALCQKIDHCLAARKQFEASRRAEAFGAFWEQYGELVRERKFDEAVTLCQKTKEQFAVPPSGGLDEEKGTTESGATSGATIDQLAEDAQLLRSLFSRAKENLPQLEGKMARISGMGLKVSEVRDGKLYVKLGDAEKAWDMADLDADELLKLGLPADGDPKSLARHSALFLFHFGRQPALSTALEEAARLGIDVSPYEPKLPPSMADDFEIPKEPQDKYGNPVGKGLETITRWPMEVRHKATGLHLVLVPSGQFMMGSPRDLGQCDLPEHPQRSVRIAKPFYMAKYETTVGVFKLFVQATGYKTDAERGGGGYCFAEVENENDSPFELRPNLNWKNPLDIPVPPTDDHPVMQITWNDAQKLVEWLHRGKSYSFALPTEAQWEYACRAGTTGRAFFGDRVSRQMAAQYAWYSENSDQRAHRVGRKRPNPWGLYDTLGNVQEWCRDTLGHAPPNLPRMPVQDGPWCIVRDGGFLMPLRDCRVTLRFCPPSSLRLPIIGCRLVLDPSGKARALRPERNPDAAEREQPSATGSDGRERDTSQKSPSWPIPGFEIPAEANDNYDNPIRKGTDEKTGLPLEIRHQKTGMHLVFVPTGEFMMGSPEEEDHHVPDEPRHRAEISEPFYLGKYEVTVAEFARFAKETRNRTDAESRGGSLARPDGPDVRRDANWKKPYFKQENDHPVVLISKGDIPVFLSWMSGGKKSLLRLPTEAEWEYACRAGTATAFYFGDRPGPAELHEHMWFGSNSKGTTHPVGKKKPNPWGLYDMCGNVHEWVQDPYRRYPGGELAPHVRDQKGEVSVFRGGSFFDDPGACRSAFRGPIPADVPSINFLGFRVAVAISAAEAASHEEVSEPGASEAEVEEPGARTPSEGSEVPSQTGTQPSEGTASGQKRPGRLPSSLQSLVSIPSEEKDRHGNSIRSGADKRTGLPLEIRHKKTGMHLVLISAGQFEMGSPQAGRGAGADERPVHGVRISKPFYLSKYETTVREFTMFVRETGHKTLAETTGGGIVIEAGRGGPKPDATWKNPYFEQTDRHPVVLVAKDDAESFAEWMSRGGDAKFRLPSEAEWEYACRAGATTRFSFGDDVDRSKIRDYAWFGGNAGGQAHPVGQKKPNDWGLYDVHGNLWEWCRDLHGKYGSEAVTDPVETTGDGRLVMRGGGWNDMEGCCRSADRGVVPRGHRESCVGFRVAMSE